MTQVFRGPVCRDDDCVLGRLTHVTYGTRVTLIIPTVPGRESLLERAGASAVDQTYQFARILPVLDSSRDGPGITRNRGLAQVETEWTAFLDDDDYLLPWHLELLISRTKEDVSLVYSGCLVQDTNGFRDPPWLLNGMYAWQQPFAVVKQALAQQNYIPSCLMVRTSLAKKVGGYPNGSDPFEDWTFLKRLLVENAVFRAVPHTTWVYDIRHSSTHRGAPGRPR